MKKFIALAVALVSMSAFAQKHMVTLSGYETARDTDPTARSLDIFHSNGGNGANRSTTNSIALNYAYAITDMFQIGAEFKNYKAEASGDEETKSNTWGVFAIYNFAGRLTDTNYLGVKYRMTSAETTDAADGSPDAEADTNTWGLEFGHRFTLGNVWGMNFSWSPSLELQFAKTETDKPANTDDSSSTNFQFNVLKVDVLF